jgi:hypothetical protein
MKFTYKKMGKLFILGALLLVLIPNLVLAQTKPDINKQPQDINKQPSSSFIPLQNPLKADSVGELIQDFVVIFSYLVILGAVLALIWVGLQFILARGNPAKMTELKEWLLWIVVGVAVVIGARLIIQVVINTLSASGAVDQQTIQSAQNAVNRK